MMRYTIRSLLLATLIIASLLAITFDRARSQKRGREWVAEQNGHVTFSHKYDPTTRSYDHSAALLTPPWMVDLMGIDFFDSVDSVILDNQTVVELNSITDIRSLRTLAIVIEIDDDLDFSPLLKLRKLERLYLDYTGIDAQRLMRLRQLLPHVDVDSAEHPPRIPRPGRI